MTASWLWTLFIAALFTLGGVGRAQAQQHRQPRVGDHVRVLSKKGVYHHGVVTGHDLVVHRDNLMAAGHLGVKETSMYTFSGGNPVQVVEDRTRPVHEVVRSAKQAAARGDRDYHPLFNNCEHEATRHVRGAPRSEQVQQASVFKLGAALGAHVMTTPLRVMAATLKD